MPTFFIVLNLGSWSYCTKTHVTLPVNILIYCWLSKALSNFDTDFGVCDLHLLFNFPRHNCVMDDTPGKLSRTVYRNHKADISPLSCHVPIGYLYWYRQGSFVLILRETLLSPDLCGQMSVIRRCYLKMCHRELIRVHWQMQESILRGLKQPLPAVK